MRDLQNIERCNAGGTCLKFINRELQTVPYSEMTLGIVFYPDRPEYAELEKQARARWYAGREKEDAAFRAKYSTKNSQTNHG